MNESKYEKLVDEMAEWGNTVSALSYLIKHVCLTNDWSYAEIWCPDAKQNFMTWAGAWAKNENNFERFTKFSSYFKFAKGFGLIGQTWVEKKIIINNDLINDKEFLRGDIAIKCRFFEAAGIPIKKKDEVVSILCFFFKKIEEKERKELNNLYEYLNSFIENKLP
jgi:hypothetical protein